MWNVRNVLRNLSYRLKASANGCTHGPKEGRELEDEYKHLWASGFRTGDWHARTSLTCKRASGPLPSYFPSGQQSGAGRSQEQRSQRESHWDWDPLRFPFTRSWLEALGWGAALGFGLNLLHVRQEEVWRRRCPLEKLTALEGRLPAWTRELYAFSMPLHSPNPLIKSVLPAGSFSADALGTSDESVSDDETSIYSLTDSEEVDRKQIRYTTESAAIMRLMREQLTSVARDYVSELQTLLGRAQNAVSDDNAQEEFNLGLFYELGIGVSRDPEKAVDHYMEAAALNHPVAVENVMFLHKFATASAQLGVRRASSSPALTCLCAPSSEVDSDSDADEDIGPQGKFWRSDTDSGGSFDASSRSRSRSNSLPDGGKHQWLLGSAGTLPVPVLAKV